MPQLNMHVKLTRLGRIKLLALAYWCRFRKKEPTDAQIDNIIDKHLQVIGPTGKKV